MTGTQRLLLYLVTALVAAAAIPVASNAWREWSLRRADADRAAVHAAVGRAALLGGDADLAAQAYAAATDLDPGSAAWREELVEAQVRQVLKLSGALSSGEVVRLQAVFGAAIASRPTPPAPLLVAYGKLLLARADDKAAKKQFQRAIEVDPKLAEAHLNLGLALMSTDELSLAAEALQQALTLEEGLPAAQFALGQVRVRQKQWDEAVKLLKPASEKLQDAAVFLTLGRAFAELSNWKEASEALERSLALRAELPAAHGLLGQAYASLGKDLLAERHLKIAWETGGDRVAYGRLGRLYLRVGQEDVAMQIFGELTQLEPDQPEPHFILASLAEKRGELAMAARAYQFAMERAQRLDKQDAEIEKIETTARAKLELIASRLAAEQQAPKPKPR